jgi:hypothetical protein
MMLRALLPLLWVLTAAPGMAVRIPGLPASPSRVPAPGACGQVAGNLPFFYDLYTFRGQAGRTAIVASYAVEAGELRRETQDGCVQYRLVVSLVLADTALGSVSRTDDSVTVRFSRTPRSQQMLRTHLEVQAPPSSSTLQRVIMSDVTTPGFGQLYHGPFPIPDYSGPELMLSDIALGEPDAEGGWTRGDVTLALLPTGRLPEGSFNLYYEVYNLPAGHAYDTEIAIERLDGTGQGRDASGREVRTRFSGESTADADGLLPEMRSIESSLPEGRYRLTVTILDEGTGRTASRSRTFQVGR